MTDVLPLSLKLANKKRKATATNVMNRAAVQAAWGALGLSLTPSAYIKKGHSNGNMRGVGASKSVIRDNCILDMDRDLIDIQVLTEIEISCTVLREITQPFLHKLNIIWVSRNQLLAD